MSLSAKTKTLLNIPSATEIQYSETQKLYFDYTILKDEKLQKWLANYTVEIRGRQYRTMQEVYEMGKILNIVKERIGYGYYLEWVETEFINIGIFSKSTAENYCAIAKAVDKFGYDKLKYFAVSAIYVAGKTRDEIDTEFQEYIFSQGEQQYLESGKTITRKEVLAEKERFKVIKNLEIEEEQKKELIDHKIPLDIVQEIDKYKTRQEKEEIAKKVIGVSKPTEVKVITTIDVETVSCTEENKVINLNYYHNKEYYTNLDKCDSCIVQHSIDREGGEELDSILNAFKDKTNSFITVTIPLDILSIRIPEGYILKQLVYIRRPKSRLWPDLDLINHLLAIAVITKPEIHPKRSIDDYFDSADYGLNQVISSYNLSPSPICLLNSSRSSTAHLSLLSSTTLIDKLKQNTLSNILIGV